MEALAPEVRRHEPELALTDGGDGLGAYRHIAAGAPDYLLPGGRLLVRSAFAGRHRAISLFRYFPEAIRVLDTYPSVAHVEAAFSTAGFVTVGFEQVPQVTAASLREVATALRREAHTPLQLINDDEYAAGLARLRKAARRETGPVVDALDLLVLT